MKIYSMSQLPLGARQNSSATQLADRFGSPALEQRSRAASRAASALTSEQETTDVDALTSFPLSDCRQKRQQRCRNFEWQEGYGAFSIGVSGVTDAMKYI